MRLACALCSLIAISACMPILPPAASNDSAVAQGETAGDSAYGSEPVLLETVDKAKPRGKGKPLPPKPDALPTYELMAAMCNFSADFLR